MLWGYPWLTHWARIKFTIDFRFLFAYALAQGSASKKGEGGGMRTAKQPERENGYWERKRQLACPLCEGVGFRMVEKDGQIRAQKCRCISPGRIATLQRQSGIPSLYWNQSLEELKPRTLEEISLLDSLRDILNNREQGGAYYWVVPCGSVDTERFLSLFANDLIRLYGHSCFWLDCRQLKGDSKCTGTEPAARWREAATKADFLFIAGLCGGLPKSRQRKALEEVLWEQIRRSRSVFIAGGAPTSLDETCQLFEDRRLAVSVFKEFAVVDPTRHDAPSRASRWLF